MECLCENCFSILQKFLIFVKFLRVFLPIFLKKIIKFCSIVPLLILQSHLFTFLVHQFHEWHVSLRFLISKLHLILLSQVQKIAQQLLVLLVKFFLSFFYEFLVLLMPLLQFISLAFYVITIKLLCFHDFSYCTISERLITLILKSFRCLSIFPLFLIPLIH